MKRSANRDRLSTTGLLAAVFVLHGTVVVTHAADAFPAVRRILETRCLSCHNSVDRKGDFALQTRPELFDSGLIEPGDPDASYLLDVLLPAGDEPPQMPKEGEPLTEQEIATIREWIQAGAVWPEGVALAEPLVDDFDWWSLRPIARPSAPFAQSSRSASSDWPRTPIDAFILDTLDEHGLTPSPEADRRTLIRRLTFDLVGLPPTPDEAAAFVNDPDPRAYERLVDRLLASPHYGERWGRHWLDVVKYADTCGYDKDKLRPNAWPYRDYVVRSFNADKPYARFVREQIAGDALYPGEPDGILGLGFLAAGPWDFIGHVEVSESKTDGKVARNLDRDEMVSNTFNTFCSVAIQCARCHNHKFDPITQQHYYSLQAVFAAVDRAERPYDLDPHVEAQRRDLIAQQESARKELKTLKQTIRDDGGEPLTEVEAELAELKPRIEPKDIRPEFGYHSAIAPSAEVEKWVQIDLGREVEISQIVLRPCYDDFADVGAGFGFPIRFRIEVADDVQQFADRTAFVAAESDDERRRRGLTPFETVVRTTSARYIRVTATQLAERQNDYIFALAEVTVLDPADQVVSRDAKVTALDSIEAHVRWSAKNLTDGIWPSPADLEAQFQFDVLERRREAILSRINPPDRQQRQRELQQQIDSASDALNELPQCRMVYAAATQFEPQGQFKPTGGVPREVTLLHRGNVQQPGDPMRPGTFPLSEDAVTTFSLDENSTEADRRAALAEWITRPDHPLTWRSIVNRIWLNHFGAGLVGTPNDFGRMGMMPTHPELLDWLADEFRSSGGSFKHLHRLIVTSAVYRQVSTHRDDQAAVDGSNQYLWRMNRRRLSAEELRDAILAVSGRLNTQMGGPGYYLFALEKPEHSPHYEYHKHDPHDPASHRRAVYRFVVRSQPDPWMTTLDCADSSQSTPQREETLTSLQALSLLNNRFNVAMAEDFAARLEAETNDVGEQVDRATLLIIGRSPNAEERKQLTAHARKHGLTNLCRLMFNLSEFVYID